MSLVEVLFTIFFISIGVLTVAAALDQGLRLQLEIEEKMIATQVANGEMDRVRKWAEDLGNFQSWNSYDAGPRPSTTNPGFTIEVASEAVQQLSPCSRLEMMYPADQRRAMNESLRKVRVTVSWGDAAGDRLTLVSMIGTPARGIGGVRVSTVNLPYAVGPDQTASFKALAYDRDGDPLPDAFLQWSVRPLSANGQVQPSRDGRTAEYIHRYRVPPGVNVYYPAGSQCVLEARAVFLGREYRDFSQMIGTTSP